MVGMTSYDESQHPRGQATNAGQFRAKQNDAPTGVLDNPRAELDAANQAYQSYGDDLLDLIEAYLKHGMPEGADRVVFEESDQGDYLYVAAAYNADGQEIDTEDDYDRWADVDEIIELLGHPDDNRQIGDLLPDNDGRRFTWHRTEPTDPANEEAIRQKINGAAAERRRLAHASQDGAILAATRLVPAGATITFSWSDQGDFLAVDHVTLADGTVVVNDFDVQSDIELDELDVIASDIRDINDPRITEVPGSNGSRFTLTHAA